MNMCLVCASDFNNQKQKDRKTRWWHLDIMLPFPQTVRFYFFLLVVQLCICILIFDDFLSTFSALITHFQSILTSPSCLAPSNWQETTLSKGPNSPNPLNHIIFRSSLHQHKIAMHTYPSSLWLWFHHYWKTSSPILVTSCRQHYSEKREDIPCHEPTDSVSNNETTGMDTELLPAFKNLFVHDEESLAPLHPSENNDYFNTFLNTAGDDGSSSSMDDNDGAEEKMAKMEDNNVNYPVWQMLCCIWNWVHGKLWGELRFWWKSPVLWSPNNPNGSEETSLGGNDSLIPETTKLIPELTSNNLGNLTKAQLKEKLKKRGKTISRKKEVLILRLQECIQNNFPGSNIPVDCLKSMNGIDITAKWELLTPNPSPIQEPTNEDQFLCPATEWEAPVNPK